MEELFTDIYHQNSFGGQESRSGHGSNLANTAALRAALPGLLARLEVRTILDIPCGDFFWMRKVSLPGVEYIGADIVSDLVQDNNQVFGQRGRRFIKLDITRDELACTWAEGVSRPRVDLIFCRDCLVHFSNVDALRALENIKRSGASWLLTTTFTNREVNEDIVTGGWRPLNLEAPPFNFSPPLELINEGYMDQGGLWADMSQGLWRLAIA